MNKFFFATSVFAILSVTNAQAEPRHTPKSSEASRKIALAIPAHAMPSYVEALSPASDFSMFLDKNCPEDLHRMALRKLWQSVKVEISDNTAI